MALKKTVTTATGVQVTDAYNIVEDVSFPTKTNMYFNLCSKVDAASDPFQKQAIVCAYDMNGENPFKQAYAHLKTLPEFANAQDC